MEKKVKFLKGIDMYKSGMPMPTDPVERIGWQYAYRSRCEVMVIID